MANDFLLNLQARKSTEVPRLADSRIREIGATADQPEFSRIRLPVQVVGALAVANTQCGPSPTACKPRVRECAGRLANAGARKRDARRRPTLPPEHRSCI